MASPEGKKGGQQDERRRSNSNGLNGHHNHSNGNSPQQAQPQVLKLKTPVIRHRDPDAPVSIRGWLFKQGSDGLQLWKKRWFVLSQFCLYYYHGPEEEKVLGSLLLPSYTIRPCLTGDKDRVFRKYAFKAEHRNTRSFYLAAESRQSMIQWMNALSLAAILQDNASLLRSSQSELNRSQLNVSLSSSVVSGSGGHGSSNGTHHRRPSSTSKVATSPGDASFDSDQPSLTATPGQRQPLYANAPPKPRRLNTSRDSGEPASCSSSPSPERMGPAPGAAVLMYGQQQPPRARMTAHVNGAAARPASLEVTTLLQQQQQRSVRNSPAAQVDRRTPDAYGRFKQEYEEVYNNSTTSSGGSSSRPNFVVAHRSEVARRVPPRPHSVDVLHQQQQQQQQQTPQRGADYWASEENYAQQVRQSSAVQKRVVRDPAEISRDIKESALWSYVRPQAPSAPSPAAPAAGHRPIHRMLSNSQENLIEDAVEVQQFHRSASARLPRPTKSGQTTPRADGQLNTLAVDQPEMDSRRVEQREESMKRLLEWKQRMLQSPLTRKNGVGNNNRSGSERSTPTLALNNSTEREASSSPRLHSRITNSPDQPSPSLNQSVDYTMGNFVTLRRTVAQAAQDLLHQERIFQQQQQQQQQQNVAFRASLKRPKVLDEEADIRKEFTYEYVLTDGQQEPVEPAVEASTPPKVCWPASSLMREKSSAIADLRARSESPSANRVLFLKDSSSLPAQLALAKTRPKPPPKPSLQDLQQAYQLKLRSNGLPLMMMMLEEEQQQQQQQQQYNQENNSGSDAGSGEQQRLSYAESLPESLAGFAASIVSEEGGSGAGIEGTISPPFEATVSPLTSECDWPHNNSSLMNGASPAPLPDLMSLTSSSIQQHHQQQENLYMNSQQYGYGENGGIQEDHYLPMTSSLLVPRSSSTPPPLPAANSTSSSRACFFEENAYVEMTDRGKVVKVSPPGGKPSSVFAGVLDPSYRSPESPRYSEISDCPVSNNKKDELEEQPHYEFIYKASSSTHAEPVYMEVPQGEEEEMDERQKNRQEESKDPIIPPPISHSRQSSLVVDTMMNPSSNPTEQQLKQEEQDLQDQLLDMMVVPPRHPRFSISDTFRPASFFLKKLETIPAEEPSNGGPDSLQTDGESTDSELVSPPPIPSSSMGIHHSRSQSLDYSAGGHSSRSSLSNAMDSMSSQGINGTELSRRRPLTVVRSLEDLLVDANDDQLTSMSSSTSSHQQQQDQLQQHPATPSFRGSTQSLIGSASIRSNNTANGAAWHQPLYENVSGAAHVRQPSRHVRQASISSNNSRRMNSSASPDHQFRQRLGSAVSLSSTVSNSSATRSEQSGAPYYYSDLTNGKGLPQQQPIVTKEEQIVVLADDCNGSLRSRSNSRGAQAQAAKQAYQHSMDRLRTARSSRNVSEQCLSAEPIHHQTPTSRNAIHGSSSNDSSFKRAQTPDLLVNHPEPSGWSNGSTPSRNGSSAGEVMRRVRSLEGLLDEDNPPQPMELPPSTTNGGYRHAEPETPPEARYARDPTRTIQRSEYQAHGEFSPWDEDQLWRDKLRRASIRHTRSMDMLDEISSGSSSTSKSQRDKKNHILPPAPEEEESCYERLLQYSATLERTRRGQTYLDGYTWDEMEQRFRKPGRGLSEGVAPPTPGSSTAATISSSTPPPQLHNSNHSMTPSSHPFLEDGLPPPAFEIDREKLRQWDLMSTAAPIPAAAEGGRRPQQQQARGGTTLPGNSSDHSSSAPLSPSRRAAPPPAPSPLPVQHALLQSQSPSTRLEQHRHVQPDLTSSHCPPTASTGGSSPVQAVAAGLTAPNGPAGKAINGIKVAYHQSGLKGKISSSLVTTQQPDVAGGGSKDMARMMKGKLPPMIGQDMSGNRPLDSRVQLSAGDLLGRTHEELVLLLIQLRRQSSALLKARDACLLEMESQVKLAALDISNRQECLHRTQELKHHVKELEKQLDKLKPLISLVDNMVKLGSSASPRKAILTPAANTAVKRNLAPLLHQQQQQQQTPPPYNNIQQRNNNNNNNTMMFHSTPQRPTEPVYGVKQISPGWEEEQISELESKHHQLAQLEKFVREEGAAIGKLTRDQHVLRLAIRGVRQATNTALQMCDYGEVERGRRQQLFLERELAQIHALLALSSKRLEDAAVEISRIEREISALHQELHRGRHQYPSHHQLNRSGGGREMVWLEGELDRVQQHVSQLQARRQELSSQVGRLTSAEYFLDLDDSFGPFGNHAVLYNGPNESAAKRKPISTWCETDLDSLNTVDKLVPPVYANSSHGYQQQEEFNHFDDGMITVDINEADERMKRYYGIVPKQPQQQQQQQPQQSTTFSDKDKEIRTVRIVKRESEKRQRDKSSKRYDDLSYGAEEEEERETSGPSLVHPGDPIMDDPVISQFSHVLTLPKRSNSGKRSPSQRNSMSELTDASRPNDQWRGSLRPRRNLSALSLGDRNSSISLEMESTEDEGGLCSFESSSTTQRSPVLTPVYTSDAAREIVEEMRRQDMISARRAVPRHKRRHITISCSQPLALEALSPSQTILSHGRARDDVDLQRALRFNNHQHPFAPDVVRSTINQAIRINEKTIDRLFSAPDKILIPERYVPEQEVEEVNEEEKQRRLKKTESIRRMLTADSASVDIPRPPSLAATGDILEPSEAKEILTKERQQRDHFINLNQMLVEEIKQKSKMTAAQSLSMESQYA